MGAVLPGIGDFSVSVIANLLSAYIYDKLKKKKTFELADLQELMKEALDSVIVQIDERLGERFLSSQETMIQRFKQEIVPEIITQIKKPKVDMDSVIDHVVEEVAKNFYSEIHREKLRLEKLNEELDSLVKSLSAVIKQYPLALPKGKEVKQTPEIKIPVKIYSDLEIGKSILTTHDIQEILESRFLVPKELARHIAELAYQKLQMLGVAVTRKMLADFAEVILLDMEYREYLPPVRKILSSYFIKMDQRKTTVNIAVLGHMAHGKSTIIGRLLYDLGVISETYLPDFAGPLKFAWLMDTLREERQKGMTIRASWMGIEGKSIFNLWNLPGHRRFIRSAILGMSQSDYAVYVVSAERGEFESGIGPGGQFREHVFLGYTFGPKHHNQPTIVLVNKMDHNSVRYSKKRFEEISADSQRLLKLVGYGTNKTMVIPVSGYRGDNIVRASTNMKWYSGASFWEAMNMLFYIDKREARNRPLRVPIIDCFKRRRQLIALGTVKTGEMEKGTTLTVMPKGETIEVVSIQKFYCPRNKVYAGDFVGVHVSGPGIKDISRGDVICDLQYLPCTEKQFIGKIIVIYHPTRITEGYTPILHLHTALVPCEFTKILRKLDPRTGKTIEKNPAYLRTGDAAEVLFRSLKPIAIDRYADFPNLGLFAMRDMGTTIAAGIVKDFP